MKNINLKAKVEDKVYSMVWRFDTRNKAIKIYIGVRRGVKLKWMRDS